MKAIWNRDVWTRSAILFLLVSHGMVLAAPWLATHDPTNQARSFPFAPPTLPRFVDAEGAWHLRPFVYRWREDPVSFGAYVEDPTTRYPIRWALAQPDPLSGDLVRRPFGVEPPGHLALLGTDRYGRDLFSRWLYGGRYSLMIGWAAGILSMALGVSLGAIAGFYGGWLDQGIQRSIDLMLALPWLYLLFAVRAFLPLNLEAEQTAVLLVLVLSVLGWAIPARLVRGVTLSVREQGALLTARTFGATDLHLLRYHIWPRVSGLAITQGMLRIPRFILAEITLSFFGLGITEPTPSWGNLLAELRHFVVLTEAWWMCFPAIVLILVILSYHRIANSLQRWSGNEMGESMESAKSIAHG